MHAYDNLDDVDLLELLYSEEELLLREAFNEFVRRGERMIEPLADIATNHYGWNREGPEWWPGIHAVYILARIGTEKTVLPLLQALRCVTMNDCEFLVMDMPAVFGSVGPDALGGLMFIASDKTSDWMTRSVALEGSAAITVKYPDKESEVFALIRSVLTDEREDRLVRSAAGHILLDFLRKEAYDDLLAFGKEEKKLKDAHDDYTADFYDSDVKKTFARNMKELEMYTRDWMEFYDDAAVAQRCDMKHDFPPEDEEWDDDDDGPFTHQKPVMLETAKIGRNEPCPCRSGKKFKKCCLGRDAERSEKREGL